MDSPNKRQAACPSEETLLAYKTRGLAGKERDAVVFHLLFCEACMEVLHQLPTETEKAVESETQGIAGIEPSIRISSRLAEAIEQFTQQEKRRLERPMRTLQEVLQEDGLKVGQIWRTRSENVAVPNREMEKSVADLDSMPHLVVVIESVAGTKSSHGDYHIIQIAPISAETEYASEGDLLVTEEESPLGYSFMIELWNEQPMLQENLDCSLAVFDPVEHKTIFEKLQRDREKLQRTSEKPLTLEETVMNGLYHDPIMRFRAHEYEETRYLRVPVQVLVESEPAEKLFGLLPVGGETGTKVKRSRPWLQVIPGGKKESIGVQEPAMLQDDRTEIRLAAQQQKESGWPREVEVDVPGLSSPVRFQFNEFGFALIVGCIGPSDLSEILIWMDKINKEIRVPVGGRAIVGPLEDFDLTHESSKEEIVNALISLGIPIARRAK